LSTGGIATFYGASALGAVTLSGEAAVGAFGSDLSIAPDSFAYSDKVLAQTDLYHSVPSLLTNDIIDGGQATQGGIGQYGTPYTQYTTPGSVNGTLGNFEVGGHWITDNDFWIVHTLFNPL
jgi:hypothetical protein